MQHFNTIKRRNLLKTLLGTSLGAWSLTNISGRTTSAKSSRGKKPVLMKVGCQHGGTTKENLEYLARHGVFNIDGGSPEFIEGVGWDLDDSMRKKEACEKYGINLDAYHLPLSSAGLKNISTPNIML
ncbi:MAG: hypothetical protein KDC53_08835, partial [Saprospiraceae bacterium]|nr:hypothetical protein [Saprospiraceae bacterium]